MRPSGDTAVASVKTSARTAPRQRPEVDEVPGVRAGRRCAEYWSIGETQMRLRNVVVRSRREEKSWLIAQLPPMTCGSPVNQTFSISTRPIRHSPSTRTASTS